MENNTSNKIVIWVVIALIVGSMVGYMVGAKTSGTALTTPKALAFQDGMRKLWEDHVTWTRLYIVEAVDGSKATSLTAERLLKNQEDIGNAVKAYYGEEAGDKLTALLKDHIMDAVAILNAAKAGDSKKLEAAKASWYQNADEIATFLNGANPGNWPLADLKDGMRMHLDMTLSEAVAQLQGKYADSINDYDQVHEHILGLADLLSSGIVTQFPDKF